LFHRSKHGLNFLAAAPDIRSLIDPASNLSAAFQATPLSF
jgi:hypothetical protein